MIQAFFRTSDAGFVPAIVPDGDLLDLAQTLGIAERDLFRIELPSGATRPGRVRVLVKQSALPALYSSVLDGSNPSSEFRWQETTNVAVQSMEVWLLPPKPLYMVAGAEGVAVVEAVDARWWWGQSQANGVNQTPLNGDIQSSDGRWQVVASGSATPLALLTALQGQIATLGLPGTFIIPGGYNPSSTLLNRVTDHLFTPECSLAMAIDLVLSATGWMLQWDNALSTLTLAPVGDDVNALDGWMRSNRLAYVGGLSAPGGGTTPSEPLMSLWYGQSAWARNLMPDSVTVSFPYRTVEGKTRYGNTTTDTTTLMFASEREFGWEQAVTTGRPRADIGTRLLKEPRPLVASATPGLTPSTPATAILGTTAPSWDYATYRTAVGNLLQTRATVMTGTVGWMGWPKLPMGSYRCTMQCYTLARRNGEIVPLTVTECDVRDWILGPDGMLPTDPKDIVLSKGLAHARRMWSGATMVDAAPPNTRVFPAVINDVLSGGAGCNAWQWSYQFTEVEPNPVPGCPMAVSIGSFARTGVARNLMEATNNPATGFIAPGVSQVNYPNANISALPIASGTLVHMVEQFPTAYVTGTPPPHAPQYWFVVPNAVYVECIEGG